MKRRNSPRNESMALNTVWAFSSSQPKVEKSARDGKSVTVYATQKKKNTGGFKHAEKSSFLPASGFCLFCAHSLPVSVVATMGDKAGKMFKMPQKKGVKSSLKSSSGKEGTLKGKDDSSVKSKKGRKVKFDAGVAEADLNFSSKYGGKGDTPTTFPKGKGDKTFSSGKSSVPKTAPPLELRIEDELPKNVKCLMACEAADILQGIQEQMVFLSRDPTIKTPVSFDRGLQYAKRGSHYTDPQSVRKVLETLTDNGVTDGEICVIADVCPETADEVFALVPSLKPLISELSDPVNEVLLELAKLKQSTPNHKM